MVFYVIVATELIRSRLFFGLFATVQLNEIFFLRFWTRILEHSFYYYFSSVEKEMKRHPVVGGEWGGG